MADLSKKMRVSDEVLNELPQENQYSDICKRKYSSDSEVNVNILLCGDRMSALMKKKISVKAVTCILAYGQTQLLSDHIFQLLPNLA
jgi:hypothetical protein